MNRPSATVLADWLHLRASVSLVLAGPCALVILIGVRRHPQHMRIINMVWPVTTLYGSVLAVWK